MQQGYRSRGSSQPQRLRFPRFSRPHSFVHSERQPKECAGSRKEKERSQRSAPAAEKEKGRKKAVRAGRDRASALKTVPCRCLSAVPGRTRLPPTTSTNKRSAKTGRQSFSAESCGQQVFEHSRPSQLRGSWCSGITPAQHARGRAQSPACPCPCAPASGTVCRSLVFFPLGLLCVLPRAAVSTAAGCRTSL